MKTTLLTLAALATSATLSAAAWTPSDWTLDKQSFNDAKQCNCTETVGDDALSVAIPNAYNNIRRAEIANKSTLSIGGENNLVVVKVTFENATFADFDQQVIYVRRQLRKGSANDSEKIEPYFITGQAAQANTRVADGETTGYYWFYLPAATIDKANSVTQTVDWTSTLEMPSSFANTQKSTLDGEDAYGFSMVGIRVIDNASTLDENAKVNFNYINITDAANIDENFATLTSAKQGELVKKFVEKQLNPEAVENPFVASKWVKSPVATFNNNCSFTTDTEKNTIEVGFTQKENADGLRRAELLYGEDLTLGHDKNLVVYKVNYENCDYTDFLSVVYVRRNLFNTADNSHLSSYFLTDQNNQAGRRAANNNTVGYYWRYLPSLGFNSSNTDEKIDWADSFTLPYVPNKTVTFEGNSVKGHSYLGIRFQHTKELEAVQAVNDNAKATVEYIEIISIDDLEWETPASGPKRAQAANHDAFQALTATQAGAKVQKYVDAVLNNVATGIEDVITEAPAALTVKVGRGIVAAPGAEAVEAYDFTGRKMASVYGSEVELPAGLYIVKATSGSATVTAKVAVK